MYQINVPQEHDVVQLLTGPYKGAYATVLMKFPYGTNQIPEAYEIEVSNEYGEAIHMGTYRFFEVRWVS